MASDTDFSLAIDETIVFETKWGTYIKAALQVSSVRVVLTNRRLLFCDTGYWGYGLMLLAAQLFYPQTHIVWEVPLASLQAIAKKRHGLANKYIVSLIGESGEYAILIGPGEDKWIAGLTSQGITLA